MARRTSSSVEGSGTDDGYPAPNGTTWRRECLFGAAAAVHADQTDSTRSEWSAGPQRTTQGKSARLAKWIARGIARGDRHEAGAACRAADDQRTLNNVISREIAAGVDLRRARAVNVADLLMHAGDKESGTELLFVMFAQSRRWITRKPCRPIPTSRCR